MTVLLRKIFIPHKYNAYHPLSIRHKTLVAYAVISIICNLLIFPLMGITSTRTLASTEISREALLEYTNIERNKLGLEPLENSPKLQEAANKKATNMFKEDYWAHFGPNGEKPWDFIQQEDYQYIYAGENLARNFTDNLELHEAWMNSPTHRDNIVDKRFNDIGISVQEGGLEGSQTILVVVMFGTKVNEKITSLIPPKISYPEGGEEFDNPNIRLEGSSKSGDTIKVYSNEEFIGELPREAENFTTTIEVLEGNNTLFLKSFDTETKAESTESGTVEFYVVETPESPPVAGVTVKNNPWLFSLGFLGDFSLTQLFNITFLVFITLAIVLDLSFSLLHGIKRKHTFVHSFSLTVVLLSCLMIAF